ncbi:MAG: ABC transporter substrate-binding protein, partial [Clostridiales Family XIII bacterium]|nr:ABC transporter substrate-binding protein [Clostridiales Family XIII bacterium]
LTGYPYDPEKAKTLLAEAGYPDGNGFPEVKIVTLDSYRTYAQTIQEDLSAIGIKAEVELSEATAMTEQLVSGNVAFSVFGISLGFDSSQYNMILCTDQPYNLAFYSNPEMDELFTEVRKEIDPEKSKETYLEILKIAKEDAVYGMLCDTLIMYAYNDSYNFEKAFENFSSSGVRPQDISPK